MKRSKQLGFALLEKNNIKIFGGAYLKNSNPKEKRPISIKNSMHLVMRSQHEKGSRSLLKFEKTIKEIINAQGRRFGVKIYRQANGGNHLHLIVLPRSRQAFNGFIRSISGLIARLVLQAQRGAAVGIQFWEKRPFTRIVSWGREFQKVCDYLMINALEAFGFVDYQPRKGRYKISTA